MWTLAVIVFSTFIGGNDLEFAGQVRFDSAGNVIVIGSTWSPDFPLIAGASPRAVDAYVVKLSPDGSRVLWGRFLGGSRLEDTLALAIDADDNIYIAGRTDSLDFPVTSNAPQKEFGGGTFDGYVAKLTSDGEIVFATYSGGSGADAPDGVAVDQGGSIVIGGDTSSVDYPLVNPYQATNRGGTDLFVTRFAPNGTVVYSTYLGSSTSDAGHAIAVDAAGNAWFAGLARTGDFPVVNAAQPQYGGGAGDAVVVGLAPDGTVITSTFLGGSGFDGGDAVAFAPDGSIWISGRSESADFPLRNPMQTLAGRFDTFLAKLDPTGRNVVLATFLGGTESDFPLDLIVGPGGQPVVCGETASLNFPTRNPVQPAHAGGFYDAYLTMLEADGSGIVFSTYFGGAGGENCSSVTRSRENLIAITGATGSSNIPLVRPLRSSFTQGEDYVAVLDFTTELHLTVTAPATARVQRPEPWSFPVENRGAYDATDVVLSLEFSQPVEARNLDSSCTNTSSGKIQCGIPTLARADSVVISGTIAATEPGTISLAAKVTAAELLRGRSNVDMEVPVTTPRRRAVAR